MQTKRFGLCAALSAAALLLLAGCAGSGSTAAPALTVESSYPLQYAKQFTVDECTGGYELITIADSQYLVVPQGAAVPEDLPQGTTVLQQPIENIYLVSTSAMDPIISLGALDSIALSGTKADGWYLPEAKAAMQAGQIAYAGKYSAPDYETILASGCGLAIENTMIYHTPEVKEQLEKFGISVLVERSSYETDPLARMEWVKLYGILLGKQQEAEQLFDTQVQRVAPLENQQPTGKTVAFFSITSNNLVTVRKGSDYVARMIEMAGGSYVFADLTDNGNNLATINLSLEDFYAAAKDADVLLYNSTIEGSIASTEQLVEKCPLLAQFKAVQNGNVSVYRAEPVPAKHGASGFDSGYEPRVYRGHPADSELTVFNACRISFIAERQRHAHQAPDNYICSPCGGAAGAVCAQPVLGQCGNFAARRGAGAAGPRAG